MDEIEDHHKGADSAEVEAYLERFDAAPLAGKGAMLEELKRLKGSSGLKKKERKALKKRYRQELVKRSALLKIAAAWLITVPVSGLLAAMLFYIITSVMQR